MRNPAYAGAYTWGRYATDRAAPDQGQRGSGRVHRAAEDCPVFLRDNHPAYLSWEQYQANLRHLEQHISAAQSPARRGRRRRSWPVWWYAANAAVICRHNTRELCVMCASDGRWITRPVCQSLAGAALEQLGAREGVGGGDTGRIGIEPGAAQECQREAPRWMVNGGYGWSGRLRTPTVYSGSTTPSSRRTAWRRGRWNETGKRLC